MYGRLEDEKPFHSVRRLVQQEDYALRVCRDAGLPSPAPYGFVELTPEREYLLVTEFFAGAVELGEATVDDQVIDDGLGIIRKLWEAGLAHRDIKPANLLVRDGRMLLIDVAFVELRPTPWRQAVDLANMMLCLALRSDPRLVYERALRQFSVDEIIEGFAAARGLALPSQLRRMLKEKGQDLHAEFVRLLPTPPQPVSIQRWSWRPVGLAVLVGLGVLVVVPTVINWSVQTDRLDTSLYTGDIGCSDQEALWLMAQAVPSASMVPCTQLLPDDWSLADVKVADGRARIVFDIDRSFEREAVTVQLAASCDREGAREVTSEHPGTRLHVRIDRQSTLSSVTRFHAFPGGCVTERLPATATPERLASEASLALGFASREALGTALDERSDSRLELNP
jgi:tRNA A-37 threonylcarbamoyl transferase component Bud32